MAPFSRKNVSAPPCCKMAPSFVSATASFASRWSLNSASTPENVRTLASEASREILAQTPFCAAPPMNRLSVCIITLNEEGNLPRALASLKEIADEIVVVDSGSTDRTAEIAREHGAIFITREFDGYAEQRNFAASRATSEWIFVLAA